MENFFNKYSLETAATIRDILLYSRVIQSRAEDLLDDDRMTKAERKYANFFKSEIKPLISKAEEYLGSFPEVNRTLEKDYQEFKNFVDDTP